LEFPGALLQSVIDEGSPFQARAFPIRRFERWFELASRGGASGRPGLLEINQQRVKLVDLS
jgi:hypothetical protein